MTDPPSSTMASPAAADLSRANLQARTSPSASPANAAEKSLVTRALDLTIRAFFPMPQEPTKFNPIVATKQLFRAMLKDEPSLVLRTPTNDKQIVLASAQLPTGETEFKKFFKVSTTRVEKHNKTHVCIGCHVLSNRTLGSIKHRSNDSHLLTWIKKERVFVESDSLGIERPTTVGYFTKLAPDLTHLPNLRNSLSNQLMLIEIDAAIAIELAPHLKQAQLDAMSNGDEFVPNVPNFEVYKTRLTHGREPTQISTEVIGVKGAPKDAKLLGEFFERLASETGHDPRNGVYIPKGAVHLLGQQTYAQVLQDNNFFLNNVATIPINLTHEAWFSVIDPNHTSETEPVSLHDHLTRQSWFMRLESVNAQKCILTTTKSNLPAARKWIDENLEKLIRKSLPQDIEPPSSSLPRRLDKPVYTATSQSYADILKKQFSLAPTTVTTDPANNRPPRKRPATIIDYDTNQSQRTMTLTATAMATATTATVTTAETTATNSTSSSSALTHSTPKDATVDYAAELASFRSELQSLRTLITTVVAQLKTDIASLHNNQASTAMETDADHPTETTPTISELMADLKHDIATIIVDLKLDVATIKSHPLFCNLKPTNQHIPMT